MTGAPAAPFTVEQSEKIAEVGPLDTGGGR